MAEGARDKPEAKEISNSVDLKRFEQSFAGLSSAQSSLRLFSHPNSRDPLILNQSFEHAPLVDDGMRTTVPNPQVQSHRLLALQPSLTLAQLEQNRLLLESNARMKEYAAQMMLTEFATNQRLRLFESELRSISSRVHQTLLANVTLQDQQQIECPSLIASPSRVDRPLTSGTSKTTVPRRLSGNKYLIPKSRIPPENSKHLYLAQKVGRKWRVQYDKLVRYQAQCGNHITPRSCQADRKLVSWVGEQRKQYKCIQRGIETPLTQARIDLLDEIGFVWNAHEAAWDRNFHDLVTFHKTYGTWTIPAEEPGYRKLSLWVKEQRRQKKLMEQGKPSHITIERIRRLEDAGFCFNPNRKCRDPSDEA